ncbi:MAG: manganese catalase family protein [Acetobacteraceae bacterium]|nr:manganese catalase family protein [Acetobacteraceae bacterium]
MFIHKPVLLHEVRVQDPDPVFAEKLLEQFGGATGELTAALTYWVQSFHCDNPGIRDMLQDIGTEELGHLEIVAMLIEQHTARASQNQQDKAYQSTLFAIRGKGPHLVDANGAYWDARYVNEGGHLARDLRADVAAEGGALNTYEALLKIATDEGTRKALIHLATREVSHTKMFMEALRSINATDQPIFGDLKPDDTVNLYFNLSSGPGADLRGPWNSEPAFQYVADPLQHELQEHGGRSAQSNEMRQLSGGQPPSTGQPPAHPQPRVPAEPPSSNR